MTSMQFVVRIGNIDDELIQQALPVTLLSSPKTTFRRVRLVLLIAALLAALFLSALAAYQSGLADPWLQKPARDATAVVQSAIEGQIKKDYTLTVHVKKITVDSAETQRMLDQYLGSDLARARGWSDTYLKRHFTALRAQYYVEYDHTKTFQPDGHIDQYFYLIRDPVTDQWSIIDNALTGISEK